MMKSDRPITALARSMMFAALWAGLYVAHAQQATGNEILTPSTSVTPQGPLPFTPVKILNMADFGAKCDGVTDDTTAIQNWLNAAAPGTTLTAPAGNCVFKSGLTMAASNQWTIEGAGNYTTIFEYEGSSATTDLLTIGTSGAPTAPIGVTLKDFGMVSQTVMTGGSAIHAYGLHSAVLSDINLDGIDTTFGTGNFCGGFRFDGAAGVVLRNPIARSLQNCGDAVRVNGQLGGTAEVVIFGGEIGGQFVSNTLSGFKNGLHMSGGFGGLRCDSTNIHNNQVGWLVDEADISSPNRDLTLGSTCALDTNLNAGFLFNDSGASGAQFEIHGWIASTIAGPGINVESAPSAVITIGGAHLYNNCGSGLYVQDATTHFIVGAGESLNTNGAINSTPCGTWQTANPGHGYGIEASSATTNIYNHALPIGNSAGAFNANSGLAGPPIVANQGSYTSLTVQDNNSHPAYFIANTNTSGHASGIFFQSAGTSEWQVGNDNVNRFMIQDNVNSNTDWMFVTTGGNATIGESSSNILTVNGVVISSAYTISALPTCNSTYKGARATVTNGAASPSFLGTVSTTGSTIAPVFCNGSNWLYGG